MIFTEKIDKVLTEKEKSADKIYEEYIVTEKFQSALLSKEVWNEGDRIISDGFPSLTQKQMDILSQLRALSEETGFINGYIYAVEQIKKYLLCIDI